MNFYLPTTKKLDKTDHEILSILHKEARISMTELGKRVHLTSQAVRNRLDRLTDLGVVHHYTVNVNCPIYGYKTHAPYKNNPTQRFYEVPVGLSYSVPQPYQPLLSDNWCPNTIHRQLFYGRGRIAGIY